MTATGSYGNFLSWFVQFRSPGDLMANHPDFLKMELCAFVCAFLTFLHAMKSGGRFKFLWLGTVMHGLFVECVSYWMPDIDSFWHAQGLITFIGQRLPLYIICLYPIFIYTASVAVAHSGMRGWAKPCAVGLSVVMLDLPYDILGIKNLFWTWHDTDPNIYDRHYWVPWTSYYFHATFAAGFTAVFLGSHKLLAGHKDVYQYAGFFKETVCLLLASLLGFPLGVVQFVLCIICYMTISAYIQIFFKETVCLLLASFLGFPLGVVQFVFMYHPLHDDFGIHTEVCVMVLLVVFGSIIWMGDRSVDRSSTTHKRKPFDEMMAMVIIHYTYFIYLVFTSHPEKNVVVGLHEPVGPCNQTEPVQTPFGRVLSKSKYLCLDNYEEPVFDFHCVEELPKEGQSWYTICGTPYENHAEYIVIICTVCGLGLVWYWNLLRNSCALPGSPKHHLKHMKQN